MNKGRCMPLTRQATRGSHHCPTAAHIRAHYVSYGRVLKCIVCCAVQCKSYLMSMSRLQASCNAYRHANNFY